MFLYGYGFVQFVPKLYYIQTPCINKRIILINEFTIVRVFGCLRPCFVKPIFLLRHWFYEFVFLNHDCQEKR